VRPSMGSVGDCYDNALCENFFATLECEWLDRHKFKTQAEARMAVFDFIEGFTTRGDVIPPSATCRPSTTKGGWRRPHRRSTAEGGRGSARHSDQGPDEIPNENRVPKRGRSTSPGATPRLGQSLLPLLEGLHAFGQLVLRGFAVPMSAWLRGPRRDEFEVVPTGAVRPPRSIATGCAVCSTTTSVAATMNGACTLFFLARWERRYRTVNPDDRSPGRLSRNVG
jgi:Integrase core domain